MKLFAIIACAAMLALGGCGTDKAEKAGVAGRLAPVEVGAAVDLVSLLDPNATVRHRIGRIPWGELEQGEKIDRAFEAFYSNYPALSRALRRDRVQERILAVSGHGCTALKNYLLSRQGDNKGFLAGLAGVARSTARIVAGLGVSTALRGAESMFRRDSDLFNMELFASLTMQVITDGIDIRRRRVLDTIERNRTGKTIEAYTVEAAVKDAIYYHSQCSVFVGMRTARDLILDDSRRNQDFPG